MDNVHGSLKEVGIRIAQDCSDEEAAYCRWSLYYREPVAKASLSEKPDAGKLHLRGRSVTGVPTVRCVNSGDPRQMKNTLAILIIMTGIGLLGVTIIGSFTSIGGYENIRPRSWEKYDSSLASKTSSMNDLILQAKAMNSSYDTLSEEKKMLSLYNVVINRFTHNNGARHTIFTNWILFVLGKVASPLGYIWDPDLFVSKGHSLICSQSSYLLMQLALKNNIRARHVGLNGHVVMEAWYDDDWHLFDPDAEVVPKDASGNILSVEELSKNMDILKKEYPKIKGDFVPIIASREDNSFVSYPMGAHFEWKSQAMFYLEKIARVLKYLIPVLFVAFGVYLKFTRNKKNALER